jgi:SAM-dependent methyltransferase
MDRLLEATFQAEREHFWFKGLRQFVTPLIEQAVAGVSHPRILDCGCGTGANLSLLRNYGDACGFDLTPIGVRYARQHGHHHVARASATDVPFASRAFDLVTSFDVLYCLRDDQERRAIAEMARIVKPGGALIVNVAALEMLRGGHSILSEEVRRYRPAMLRERLEPAGFDIVRITFTNATLFPLMLGVRTVQRLTGMSAADDTTKEIALPSKPINAALSALLSLEARALRVSNMPFGSSLLCFARKRIDESPNAS